MKRIDFPTDPRVEDVGQRLPFTLYKYIRLDNEESLARLKRLLDGELFFATASSFNDPFECAIAPSFEAPPDAIREYVRDWVRRNGRDPREHSTEVEAWIAQSTTADFRQRVRGQYRSLMSSYGISCFTATDTNLLMWSYYAAGHTGVVLGIDTIRFMQNDFGAPIFPLDVQYVHDFPVVNYYTDDDFELARKTIATKAHDWEHEQEWRWILVGKSGSVRLTPETIATIVFGLRTPPGVEATIRAWLVARTPTVDIRRATVHENSFALEIVNA
jgi:hypothetical protein